MAEQVRLMKTRIQLRRDTEQNWVENNPVLSQGEPGWDTTNDIFKIGDGTTPWNALPAVSDVSTNVETHHHTVNFTQDTPATDWVINHGLGRHPSVSVVDTAGSVVFGDVNYLSDNTIVVSFSSATAGKAYLN